MNGTLLPSISTLKNPIPSLKKQSNRIFSIQSYPSTQLMRSSTKSKTESNNSDNMSKPQDRKIIHEVNEHDLEELKDGSIPTSVRKQLNGHKHRKSLEVNESLASYKTQNIRQNLSNTQFSQDVSYLHTYQSQVSKSLQTLQPSTIYNSQLSGQRFLKMRDNIYQKMAHFELTKSKDFNLTLENIKHYNIMASDTLTKQVDVQAILQDATQQDYNVQQSTHQITSQVDVVPRDNLEKVPPSRAEVKELQEWTNLMVSQIEAEQQYSTVQEMVENLQLVYSTALKEIIRYFDSVKVRQVGIECLERGHLLQQIWNVYVSLLEQVVVSYHENNKHKELEYLREVTRLHQTYGTLEDGHKEQFHQLQDKNKQLQSQNESITNTNNYLKGKLLSLSSEIKELHMELDDIKLEKEDLLKQIINLKSQQEYGAHKDDQVVTEDSKQGSIVQHILQFRDQVLMKEVPNINFAHQTSVQVFEQLKLRDSQMMSELNSFGLGGSVARGQGRKRTTNLSALQFDDLGIDEKMTQTDEMVFSDVPLVNNLIRDLSDMKEIIKRFDQDSRIMYERGINYIISNNHIETENKQELVKTISQASIQLQAYEKLKDSVINLTETSKHQKKAVTTTYVELLETQDQVKELEEQLEYSTQDFQTILSEKNEKITVLKKTNNKLAIEIERIYSQKGIPSVKSNGKITELPNEEDVTSSQHFHFKNISSPYVKSQLDGQPKTEQQEISKSMRDSRDVLKQLEKTTSIVPTDDEPMDNVHVHSKSPSNGRNEQIAGSLEKSKPASRKTNQYSTKSIKSSFQSYQEDIILDQQKTDERNINASSHLHQVPTDNPESKQSRSQQLENDGSLSQQREHDLEVSPSQKQKQTHALQDLDEIPEQHEQSSMIMDSSLHVVKYQTERKNQQGDQRQLVAHEQFTIQEKYIRYQPKDTNTLQDSLQEEIPESEEVDINGPGYLPSSDYSLPHEIQSKHDGSQRQFSIHSSSSSSSDESENNKQQVLIKQEKTKTSIVLTEHRRSKVTQSTINDRNERVRQILKMFGQNRRSVMRKSDVPKLRHRESKLNPFSFVPPKRVKRNFSQNTEAASFLLQEIFKQKTNNQKDMISYQQINKMINLILGEAMKGEENYKVPMYVAIYDFFLNKYGFKQVAEKKIKQVYRFIYTHKDENAKLQVVALLCSMEKQLDDTSYKLYLDSLKFLASKDIALKQNETQVPLDFAIEYLNNHLSNWLDTQSIAQLALLIKSKAVGYGKNLYIDYDWLMNKVLRLYFYRKEDQEKSLKVLFEAADLDGNKLLEFSEFKLIYREIEQESFDKGKALQQFIQYADYIDEQTKDKMITLARFAELSIDLGLFHQTKIEKYAEQNSQLFDAWSLEKDLIKYRFLEANKFRKVKFTLNLLNEFITNQQDAAKSGSQTLDVQTLFISFKLVQSESKRVILKFRTKEIIMEMLPIETLMVQQTFRIFDEFTL